jgi:HK97 gp10 family phage protein
MMVDVKVTGLQELADAMQRLPTAMQQTVVRAGLTAAGQVFVNGMARRAPKDPNHRVVRRGQAYPVPLSQSMTQRLTVSKGVAKVRVGPSSKAFWGRFQEFGTRFQPAQPFMAPTLKDDDQRAVAAFVVAARAQMDTAISTARGA